jgi:hypothetical protein
MLYALATALKVPEICVRVGVDDFFSATRLFQVGKMSGGDYMFQNWNPDKVTLQLDIGSIFLRKEMEVVRLLTAILQRRMGQPR